MIVFFFALLNSLYYSHALWIIHQIVNIENNQNTNRIYFRFSEIQIHPVIFPEFRIFKKLSQKGYICTYVSIAEQTWRY